MSRRFFVVTDDSSQSLERTYEVNANRLDPMVDMSKIFESLYLLEDDRFTAAIAILRAEHEVKKLISGVLAKFDMAIADWAVLMTIRLAVEQHLKLSEIAARLKIHPTTAAYLVEHLEQLGYVDKMSVDRRAIFVSLSKAGIAHSAKVHKALAMSMFGVGDISASETKRLTRILSKVRN